MKPESAMQEISYTVMLAFSKFIKDFKIEINEIHLKNTLSWRFSFSYHCLVSGEDISVSEGADVGDKQRIIGWVFSSLLATVDKKNVGRRLLREYQEIEKKGEGIGFSTYFR